MTLRTQPRHDYRIILELTTRAPLAHGMGNAGNEQILRTTDYRLRHEDGSTSRGPVPHVSGAALKATLREHAVKYYLRALGIGEGTLKKDGLRLLLKGGRIGSGGSGLELDEIATIRHLFPPVGVFGAMEGSLTIRGRIQCSPVLPWCRELQHVHQAAAAFVREGQAVVHGGELPPLTEAWGDPEQRYGHDLSTGKLAHYLEGGAVKQIEEKRANVAEAKGDGRVAKKVERREANESMPYQYQVIACDTPMLATIMLEDVTEVEFTCVGLALASWAASGGHLGGVWREDFGRCDVKIARCARLTMGGPVTVELDTHLPVCAEEVTAEASRDRYHAHLQEVKADVYQRLGLEA